MDFNKTTKIELIHNKEVEDGTLKDGLPVAPSPETFAFQVYFGKDALPITVPNDITNPHYREVRIWYESQKTKPFKFKFLPDPKSDVKVIVLPIAETVGTAEALEDGQSTS